MKALVTGGGGFVGQYVVERLVREGWQVRSYSRRHYDALDRLGVEQHQGDIGDRQRVLAACRECQVVFHTVAIAGIWGRWDDFYRTNTLGTEYVIDGCRQAGVGKLVFTSSPSVTFDGNPQTGVDESAPYPASWLCHYPHTKALAEQAVLAANDAHLRTCALRPHLIWGPRDQHLIPRLIDRARRGRLRRVGDGSNLVDMVYVENAAHAHWLAARALDGPAAGKAYFISQGDPVNCWDWIDDILALADLPPVRHSISFPAAWRVGQVFEWVYRCLRRQSEPMMTRFLAAQLAHSHYFSLAAARRDLGYSAIVSTDEGMRRLAAWLNREGRRGESEKGGVGSKRGE